MGIADRLVQASARIENAPHSPRRVPFLPLKLHNADFCSESGNSSCKMRAQPHPVLHVVHKSCRLTLNFASAHSGNPASRYPSSGRAWSLKRERRKTASSYIPHVERRAQSCQSCGNQMGGLAPRLPWIFLRFLPASSCDLLSSQPITKYLDLLNPC